MFTQIVSGCKKENRTLQFIHKNVMKKILNIYHATRQQFEHKAEPTDFVSWSSASIQTKLSRRIRHRRWGLNLQHLDYLSLNKVLNFFVVVVWVVS